MLFNDSFCFSVKDLAVNYEVHESDNAVHKTAMTLPMHSTALDVMKAAVDHDSQSYKFVATYYGSNLGFFINAIGNTPTAPTAPTDKFYWAFYYSIGDGKLPIYSDKGVSNFIIPSSGYTIIMKYEQIKANDRCN